jgi:hypothetical protein
VIRSSINLQSGGSTEKLIVGGGTVGTDADLIIDGAIGHGAINVNNVIRSSINLQSGGSTRHEQVNGAPVGRDGDLIIDGAIGNGGIGGINVNNVLRSSINLGKGGTVEGPLIVYSVSGTASTDLIIDGAAIGGIDVNNVMRPSINLQNGGSIGTNVRVNGGNDADLIINGDISSEIDVNNVMRPSIDVQSGGNVLGPIRVTGTSINSTVTVKGNVSGTLQGGITTAGENTAITILKGGIIGVESINPSCITVQPGTVDATVIVEGGGEVVCPIQVFGPGATIEVKEEAKTDIIKVFADGTQTVTIAAGATVASIEVCYGGVLAATVLCNGETLAAPNSFCSQYAKSDCFSAI